MPRRFDEDEHPRDDDGKFSDKPGGDGGSTPKPATVRDLQKELPTEKTPELSKYRGVNFVTVNGGLRGTLQHDKEDREIINHMDGLMKKSPGLEHEAFVFRGISSNAFLNKKEGDIVRDLGYMSTTTDSKVAMGFTGKAVGELLSLNLPPKTKGLALGGSESEVILPRGSAVRIKKIVDTKTNKGRLLKIYHAELVDHGKV